MNSILLLAFISTGSVLIPLSLAVIQWSKLPKDIAWLRVLLICSGVSDVLQITMALLGIHNLVVGNTYMLIQFTILLYMLSLQFERKRSYTIIYVSLVILYAFGLILSRNDMDIISPLNAVASLALIIVSILFFYKLINELRVENIHRQPIVWIAFATLFYYSGTLFIFLTFSYLIKTDSLKSIWMLQLLLNITKNILFAVALWQSYRAVKSSA